MQSCCVSNADITQTPNEKIIYTIDWPSRGLPEDTTIVSQTLTASSSDVTISSQEITDDNTTVTFMLTGGVAGNVYTITNHIVLSDTQEWDEMLSYNCVAVRPINPI